MNNENQQRGAPAPAKTGPKPGHGHPPAGSSGNGSSGKGRSRLPTPSSHAPLSARRPSPPPPLSARRPGGSGVPSQLRLPTPGNASTDVTPRNFMRAPTPATARGAVPTLASRLQRSDGSQTARGLAGGMVAGACPTTSTYRDALITPRKASNASATPQTARQQAMAAASATGAGPSSTQKPAMAASPGPLQQQPTEQQDPPPPTQQQQQQQVLAAMQQQGRLLSLEQARACHDQAAVQQQISRLESSLVSQQEELQSRLAAVLMLGERREALAERLAALQQLCARAQAVEEGRRAELQNLGLASDAVRLALEQHQAQEAASGARLAAARSALLHMMRNAAHALSLPSLLVSLQEELRRGSAAPLRQGSGNAMPAVTAAAAAALVAFEPEPAVSAAAGAPIAGSATKPVGKARPMAEPEAARSPASTPASSCSEWSASDSCSSACSSPRLQAGGCTDEHAATPVAVAPAGGGAERAAAQARANTDPQQQQQQQSQQQSARQWQRRPPLPPLRLCLAEGQASPAAAEMEGATEAVTGAEGHGSAAARRAPTGRIPGVALVSPPPMATVTTAGPAMACCESAGSCSLSPEVLQRLSSIHSKLEAALADQALEVDE